MRKQISNILIVYEPFAIIQTRRADTLINFRQPIGEIEIKDAGLTIFCDYETIKKLAKQESLKLGGNCMVITEHKKPDKWSTCHRIKADIYNIDNPEKYEKEIV